MLLQYHWFTTDKISGNAKLVTNSAETISRVKKSAISNADNLERLVLIDFFPSPYLYVVRRCRDGDKTMADKIRMPGQARSRS